MAGETEVHVSQLLDERGLGAFQIKLVLWSTLIALIDGYDIGAIAFAAPHLIQGWHIPPKSLGLVLTASIPARTETQHIQAGATFERIFAALRELPGVSAAAGVMGLPDGPYGSDGL